MITFNVSTSARNQLIKIDSQVQKALSELNAQNGVATIFCPHTTGGITINENADPDVCHDLVEDLNRLIPGGQSFYKHMEGNSDSHLKCSLIGASEQVIIENGRMVLGTWQSLYFWEFDGPRNRKVHVTFTPA
jgi:secondary thiamine-phosphate synthase enzyme